MELNTVAGYVARTGEVSPWPYNPPANASRVAYLKMLLAKPEDAIFALPSLDSNSRKASDLVRPLAALFLSEIIRRGSNVRTSEAPIEEHEGSMAR